MALSDLVEDCPKLSDARQYPVDRGLEQAPKRIMNPKCEIFIGN